MMSPALLNTTATDPLRQPESKLDEILVSLPRFITRQPLLDGDFHIIGY